MDPYASLRKLMNLFSERIVFYNAYNKTILQICDIVIVSTDSLALPPLRER